MCSVICATIPLQSVLVRFDYLIMPNGKKIYVLFELHIPAFFKDKEQLSSLESMLTRANWRGQDRMHVMVEVPSFLTQQFAQNPKVTYDLVNNIGQSQSVIAEDMEIRCKSLAAYYLLSLSREDLEDETVALEQYNAGSSWCTTGEITIRDLLQEFRTQKTDLCLDRHYTRELEPIYHKKFDEINQAEILLQKVLDDIQARPDERILDLVRRLYGDNHSIINRICLKGKISDLGSHLFDLHILRKILQSPQKYCMVVAGNQHGEWVCEAMEHLGATYQISEGEGLVALQTGALCALQSAMGLSQQ